MFAIVENDHRHQSNKISSFLVMKFRPGFAMLFPTKTNAMRRQT
jgi:hypothetical protein